jgi:transcriptional regulator with XRE-family HTH domain
LAERLNALFGTVRPPGERREYTNSEVAAATGMSATYVGYLRKGIRDNPSVDAVQALARFFGVRPSYFVDDEAAAEPADGHPEASQRLMRALRDPGIQRLAMRAAEAELSPAAIDAVTAMIEEVRRLDQAAEQGRQHRTGRGSGPAAG